MPIPFNKFKQRYNKYCISYKGTANEHMVQLRILLPQLRDSFNNVEISLSCPPGKLWLLDGEGVEDTSDMYVRTLQTKMNSHTVDEFLSESSIKIKPLHTSIEVKNGICLIVPEGNLPTRPFHNINYLEKYARQQGFTPLVVGNDSHRLLNIPYSPTCQERLDLLRTAVAVIGVESDLLFLGAYMNKYTALVPTGLGTNLYQNMFPKGKVLKNLLLD